MARLINKGVNYRYLPLSTNKSQKTSASTKLWIYFRRLLKFEQMDFEFAFWQMVYLFIGPQKVFQNFQHRNQSKAQFARDDPAFLVLFMGCLSVIYLGYMLVLNLSVNQFLVHLLKGIFIDCLGCGVLTATVFWFFLNRYTDIEWGYAFDIHLNAFFPPIIIFNICQLFLYMLYKISEYWFLFAYIENIVWLVNLVYYFYITFLGYRSLQILNRPELLLIPIPIIILIYFLNFIVNKLYVGKF